MEARLDTIKVEKLFKMCYNSFTECGGCRPLKEMLTAKQLADALIKNG